MRILKFQFIENNTVWIQPSENEYSSVVRYTSDPLIDGFITDNNAEKLDSSISLLIFSMNRRFFCALFNMYCSRLGIVYFIGVVKSIKPNKLDNLQEIKSKLLANNRIGLGTAKLGINFFLFFKRFNCMFCEEFFRPN